MEHPIPDDLTSLTDRQIDELIRESAELERRVSDRRTKLQDRLDFLRSGGGGSTTTSGELIDKLGADEKRLSEDRRRLHGKIDLLRAERLRRNRA